MTEPRIYQERESRLVALARSRFANPLSPGELLLIRNSVRPGPPPPFSEEDVKMRGETPYNVRGSMLRWLVNEQEAAALIDPNGLFIVQTRIDEIVDFSSCKLQFNLTFDSALLAKGMDGTSGSFKEIWIINSKVHGEVSFADATIASNVQLTGSEYCEVVDFTGAHVNGDIDCQTSTFSGEFKAIGLSTGGQINFNHAKFLHTPASVWLDVATIGGELFMENLHVSGTFRAPRLRVGQDVHAAEAQFNGTERFDDRPFSLLFMSVDVQGLIDFSGASFAASVSLIAARVQERITFQKARFYDNEGVLDLGAAVIGNDLVMEKLVTSGSVEMTSGSIKGEVNFLGATLKKATFSEVSVGESFNWWQLSHPADLNLSRSTLQKFVSDEQSWPAPGGLNLVGTTYKTLELRPLVPSRSETLRRRILWLERQSRDGVYPMQPWQQLATLYETSGDNAGAKHVLFLYSRTPAQRGRWITRPSSYIFDKIVEEPLLIAVPISLFWGLGALVFWRAQRMEKMAPTERTALERFNAGESIENYPRFHPVAYALENVLPVVKLGQDAAWAPNPARPALETPFGWRRFLPQVEYRWLVRLRWTLILAGWVMALILAGAIGSRFK